MTRHLHPALAPAVALALAAVLALPALAETIIDTPTLATQTWTEAGSPYLVMQTAAVGAGQVLTIEPGAAVRLAPGVGLLDDGLTGTIVAIGSADHPIHFTALADPPSHGSYGDLVLAAPGTVVRHAVILHATGVHVAEASLDDTTIELCGGPAALTVDAGGFQGSGLVVRHSLHDGVHVGEWASVTLTGCEIRDNPGRGVVELVGMLTPSTVLQDCLVQDNGGDGVVRCGRVLDCTVTGNGGHGILWGHTQPFFTATEIRGCDILANGGSGVFVDTFVGSEPGVLTGCNLDGNGDYGLDASHSHFYDTIDASGNYWGETTLEGVLTQLNLEAAGEVEIATVIYEPFSGEVGIATATWSQVRRRFH